jgi:hypothetical protein
MTENSAIRFTSHNPTQGVVVFSYYGSPATGNPVLGIINSLRFRAVADGNTAIETNIIYCPFD